ncbi:MAG: DUF3341 domain-containing protein [Thermoanaerobaculia bacterium]
MGTKEGLYGLLAEFNTVDGIKDAACETHLAGYRKFEAYTPFPVEGLPEAVGMKWSFVPFFSLGGGITGGLGGFFMCYYANMYDYPLNVAGKPLNSWPSFIPVTFELTILGAALATVLAELLLNRLPMPNHPVFNDPRFLRASSDRFFLCVEAEDPEFDLKKTREFLEKLTPHVVSEVEW